MRAAVRQNYDVIHDYEKTLRASLDLFIYLDLLHPSIHPFTNMSENIPLSNARSHILLNHIMQATTSGAPVR